LAAIYDNGLAECRGHPGLVIAASPGSDPSSRESPDGAFICFPAVDPRTADERARLEA